MYSSTLSLTSVLGWDWSSTPRPYVLTTENYGLPIVQEAG